MPSGSTEPSGPSNDGHSVHPSLSQSNDQSVPLNSISQNVSQSRNGNLAGPLHLPPIVHTPGNRGPPPPPPREANGIPNTPSEPNRAIINIQPLPDSNNNDQRKPWWNSWKKKYVLLCGTCGFSSLFLGIFYLIIYFVLKSYTSSLEFFQTIPTYIPGATLMITGFGILLFVKRKLRTRYLIRLVGLLCLVSSVFCVVVTVSTTVLHMNRLQTLRECTFYTQLHSCTCLPFTNEEPFELKLSTHITTCDVIHGPLYSSLRAMFGVSVIGILVSIFSCMLVYQLLSHEKKKMYWEQLETRRRQLYRHAAPLDPHRPCDDYGFVSNSELYPWNVWDSVEERRYWNGTPQVFSPNEDSSNASRSVLLGGAPASGTPSLWLPWGGAWGATNSHPSNSTNDFSQENSQLQEGQELRHVDGVSSGVVLRPFIPTGYDARIVYRRPPLSALPPNRRPLSDPGAFAYPGYPPPFTENYIPPRGLSNMEGFPSFIWDPPPPYSQPVSSENLAITPSLRQETVISSVHEEHTSETITTITQTTISNPMIQQSRMGRFLNSPKKALSPAKSHNTKSPKPLFKSVLLSNAPFLRSLDHVKSLDDISQRKNNSISEAMTNAKKISLDRPNSQGDLRPNIYHAEKSNNVNDSKGIYSSGKFEQESELYFADVSSCVSGRPETEDFAYYTEAIPSKPMGNKPQTECHLYEEVGDKEESVSRQPSDDTMIVHTSSDHSQGTDADNAYSLVSPATDASSISPMVTDTDAYSCYQSLISPVSPTSSQCANVNQQNLLSNSRINNSHVSSQRCQNTNMLRLDSYHNSGTVNQDEPIVNSDMNGNPSCSEDTSQVISARRINLSLPLQDCRSPKHQKFSSEHNNLLQTTSTPNVEQCPSGKRHDLSQAQKSSLGESGVSHRSEPSTPSRKLNSVQDLLFALKSINV